MNILKTKWKVPFTRSRSSCTSTSPKPPTDDHDHVLYVTRSWPSTPMRDGRKRHQLAPHGCFTVYVGNERRRFVVGIKHASHPLFKMLLEDAELEYGYNSEGPLLLPCDVDAFYRVLAEMENDDSNDQIHPPAGCAMSFVHGSYSPLSPSKLHRMNRFWYAL